MAKKVGFGRRSVTKVAKNDERHFGGPAAPGTNAKAGPRPASAVKRISHASPAKAKPVGTTVTKQPSLASKARGPLGKGAPGQLKKAAGLKSARSFTPAPTKTMSRPGTPKPPSPTPMPVRTPDVQHMAAPTETPTKTLSTRAPKSAGPGNMIANLPSMTGGTTPKRRSGKLITPAPKP